MLKGVRIIHFRDVFVPLQSIVTKTKSPTIGELASDHLPPLLPKAAASMSNISELSVE